MSRYAFLLRLKPGTGPDYDKAHTAVWPELLTVLKDAGISDYSIFRRDELLVLTMRIEGDFEAAWKRISEAEVNARWQNAMAEYFAPQQETRPDERFPMMQEVFYLP
ncbi:L-rhamnose mutarotase [Occallatibacter riparius]|uniref:L-rhamnose mutarotase n=1 Tax=Occallatibacter riparius TaxID=1002689 RepID=A0A9J7BUI1_9BACT|nr:L-rhamnose mutarotase [Occallatibacter riparius]UWZ84582.1 L-rhamnose mutarotase [Occallatibacter riparius]